MCAVHTGERTLCVTAGHVYSKYLVDRARYRDLECQVGSVRVKLEDYLVDHNQELDLATFELSPILLAGTRMVAHGAGSWPPSRLQEGEIVVLGGYPGLLREEQVGRVGTTFLSIMARVAQTSADHSATLVGKEDADSPTGAGKLPTGAELGGLSGGPAYRYHVKPLEYLELVGFIYEASLQYEIVFARHASCISSSGRITASPDLGS